MFPSASSKKPIFTPKFGAGKPKVDVAVQSKPLEATAVSISNPSTTVTAFVQQKKVESSDSEDENLLEAQRIVRKSQNSLVAHQSIKRPRLENVREEATNDDSILKVTSVPPAKRIRMQPKSQHKSEGSDTENVKPSSSLKGRKNRKTKKASTKYDLFPASMSQETPFERLTVYFTKTGDGIEGLEFKNIGGRPVIGGVSPAVIMSGGSKAHLQEDDVVLSINSLDARYHSYERMMSELQYRPAMPVSGDARASIKNAVNDKLVVLVVAHITKRH